MDHPLSITVSRVTATTYITDLWEAQDHDTANAATKRMNALSFKCETIDP